MKKSKINMTVEIGKYIDILIDDGLYITVYITNFKPDLEGIDGVEEVLFFEEPEAKDLLGEGLGTTVKSGKSKIQIIQISDEPLIQQPTFYMGITKLTDLKLEINLNYKTYDILEAYEDFEMVNLEVYYFKYRKPGKIIKNRNEAIKMRRRFNNSKELFKFIEKRTVHKLKLTFLNGASLIYSNGIYHLSFKNKKQRNFIVNCYLAKQNKTEIDLDGLKANTDYYINGEDNIKEFDLPELDFDSDHDKENNSGFEDDENSSFVSF